ncbi:28601_t:CDS:1, partial [Dentiscutata erythropus]
ERSNISKAQSIESNDYFEYQQNCSTSKEYSSQNNFQQNEYQGNLQNKF